MIGKTILNPFSLLVPFTSLVEDDVNDFVVFTYVLGWCWDKFVSRFAK